MLENVKNLLSHDKGNTFKVILQTLRDDVHYKVIDGQQFVPQHRERIIIMDFRNKTDFSWDYLQMPAVGPRLSSILHPHIAAKSLNSPILKGGSEILVSQREGKRPPRLTPHECARLMGFLDKFKIRVSDIQAYQ